MHVEIVRATSEGETLLCKIELKSHDEWGSKVLPALKRLDDRVFEMNGRYIAALKVAENFPPEYQGAFKCAVDALYGRHPERLTNLPWPPKEGSDDSRTVH